jgi:hypothetical protein
VSPTAPRAEPRPVTGERERLNARAWTDLRNAWLRSEAPHPMCETLDEYPPPLGPWPLPCNTWCSGTYHRATK